MAMSKAITLPSGVVTTYHRIRTATVRFNVPKEYAEAGFKATVELEVEEYLSQAEREAGLTPVRTESRVVAVKDPGNLQTVLYSALAAPIEYVDIPSGDPAGTVLQTPITPDTGYNGATPI